MEMSTSEKLLYTATKISTFKNGVPVSTGTGFFYNIIVEKDAYVHLLITNKHVIDGADLISIVFHRLDQQSHLPTGEFVTWSLAFDDAGIVRHPDPETDLCALPMSGLFEDAAAKGKSIFFIALDKSIIPSEEQWDNFDAIEEVIMLGCPRGLYDEFNNLPIVRRGATATSLTKKYNGRNQFVIDMACFPGSSGSPVLMNQTGGYLDKKTRTYMMGGNGRLFLLGILYAGPLIRNDGSIILNDRPRVEVATTMHLGFVIRSTELMAIEELVLERVARERAVS